MNDRKKNDTPYMNYPAYKATDMLNEARDKLVEVMGLLSEANQCVHRIGQSEEWREAGGTNAKLASVHSAINEAAAFAGDAHVGTLNAVMAGQDVLSRAFKFDEPKNPRGDYDGVQRGCSC